MKLSNAIYGMIIMISVIMIFVVFNSNMIVGSGITITSADNATMSTLTNIKNISNDINTIKGKVTNENEQKSWVEQVYYDLVGKYFEQGLAIVKLIPNTLNLFDSMLTSIFGRITILGIALTPLSFLYSVGLTALIVFALLSIFLGRDV